MQNRKSVWAVFVLLLTLTLFFSTLPLYANSIDPGTGANANAGEMEGSLPDGYNTTIPDQNTNGEPYAGDSAAESPDTHGNDHSTLGDRDGDGRIGRSAADVSTENSADVSAEISAADVSTENSAADTSDHGGFSWGWLLFILLLVAVVVVILLLCMPRRS